MLEKKQVLYNLNSAIGSYHRYFLSLIRGAKFGYKPEHYRFFSYVLAYSKNIDSSFKIGNIVKVHTANFYNLTLDQLDFTKLTMPELLFWIINVKIPNDIPLNTWRYYFYEKIKILQKNKNIWYFHENMMLCCKLMVKILKKIKRYLKLEYKWNSKS